MKILFLLLAFTNFDCPPELMDHAESYKTRVYNYWGLEDEKWSPPVKIVWNKTSHPSGVTVSYNDGGNTYNHITVNGDKTTVLNDVLPHEINHAVMSRFTINTIDRWISEGSSQLFESELHKEQARQRTREMLNNGVNDFSAFDWLGGKSYPRGDAIHNLYDTSFCLVEHLTLKHGPKAVFNYQIDRSLYSEAKWRKHFNESVGDTFASFRSYYVTDNKTTVYFASDEVYCAACRKFEDDLRAGKFTNINFVRVKPEDIGAPKIPAFSLKPKNSRPDWMGYGDSGTKTAAETLWDSLRSILKTPDALANDVEKIVSGQPVIGPAPPPTPKPAVSMQVEAPPVPKETQVPYVRDKDAVKELEEKLNNLVDLTTKLAEIIKDSEKTKGEKVTEVIKTGADIVKESVEVKNDVKESKENPEGDPWYIILISAIFGVIKRRFLNRGPTPQGTN